MATNQVIPSLFAIEFVHQLNGVVPSPTWLYSTMLADEYTRYHLYSITEQRSVDDIIPISMVS
jgi:hypothetical protein